MHNESPTQASPSVGHWAKSCASRRRRRATPSGSRPLTAPIRWRCSKRRTRPASRTWSPIRYGRMSVSPFTFYRGSAADHGLRPGAAPRSRTHGAALRRRAPLELRRLRLARAHAALRPQRLRRDAAGPVRVGRQAPRGELRRRGTRQRLRRGRVPRGRARRGALLSRAHARVRRRCATSRSGTRTSPPTTRSHWCARRPTPAQRRPRRPPRPRAATAAAMARRPRGTSPRRARATTCRRSPSSPRSSTACAASARTRRCCCVVDIAA